MTLPRSGIFTVQVKYMLQRFCLQASNIIVETLLKDWSSRPRT